MKYPSAFYVTIVTLMTSKIEFVGKQLFMNRKRIRFKKLLVVSSESYL